MKKYKWAILGCGKIAKKFSADLKLLPQAELYAAASRDLEKAEAFAEEFGYQKAYGSYEALVSDPEVEVVYIATPHSFHKAHSILCLEHKKAVLCEKAFAINAKEVQSMIDASEKEQTFLMEAFWTIFQPKFKKVKELAQDPSLGALKFVKSDFLFNPEVDPGKRLYNRDLGAGSLLDIGIYPVFRSMQFLGLPTEIQTMTHMVGDGVEESIVILMRYANEAIAVLTSSFAAQSMNETELCFEHGSIKFERDHSKPIYLRKNGETEEILVHPGEGMGYELEAQHVMDCLGQGLTQSPVLPLSYSLEMMELLDRIRAEAGIVFPNHD